MQELSIVYVNDSNKGAKSAGYSNFRIRTGKTPSERS